MELALYCPNYGYYEREKDNIGRGGDYYTSVSVGSLFGELLAVQFAEWLESGPLPRRSTNGPDQGSEAVCIVEAGAHHGDLARDILGWLRANRAALFDRLEYWIVEPSGGRQRRQQARLAEFGTTVRWADDFRRWTGEAVAGARSQAPVPLRGVIFSNELLDAMPVHRLGWDAVAKRWFEWGVAVRAGRFVWTRIPDSGPQQAKAPASFTGLPVQIPRELMEVLPDGFTTEVCPAAEHWWRTAAAALGAGKLVTLDYGLEAEEFFVPGRREGTVRGYHCHQSSSDVLGCPGSQDITAHVNFTAIRSAGEAVGLRTELFLNQAQFLTRIAARTQEGQGCFGLWTPERARQFQTLVHPEHLGRPFRVLVQERL